METAGAVPTLPALFHVGCVVRDIEATAAGYARRLGLGPLVNGFDLTVTDALYLGERTTFSARFEFLELGNTQIELIQPLSGRSPYSDALDEIGEGPHHLAFVVPSIETYVDALRRDDPSAVVVLEAQVPERGDAFTYVQAGGGLLVELLFLGG